MCKAVINECNKKEWRKHQWNNYTTGTNSSEATKELDVMNLYCTREQQDRITVTTSLIRALDEYQRLCSWEGDKTGGQWLSRNLVLFVSIDTTQAV